MSEKNEKPIPPQDRMRIRDTRDIISIAQKNFSVWNDALKTKKPEIVAALYAKDATFLPTVSGKFKKGQVGAEKYFEHFLEKNPAGKIIEEEVQTLGRDCYVHSGMYNFEVGPEDNRETVEARFSFVWMQNDQGEWKILHHHSSLKPKG